jgi:hypothetical protein
VVWQYCASMVDFYGVQELSKLAKPLTQDAMISIASRWICRYDEMLGLVLHLYTVPDLWCHSTSVPNSALFHRQRTDITKSLFKLPRYERRVHRCSRTQIAEVHGNSHLLMSHYITFLSLEQERAPCIFAHHHVSISIDNHFYRTA